MRSILVLALLSVLAAPLAAAASLGDLGAAPRIACLADPLSFPPNPFAPGSPAGQLYAGATGTINVVWVTAEKSPCIVAGIVNAVCIAETGSPCLY